MLIQACRILLSYGCDTTIVSLQGYTAAQLATESVAKLLAEEPVHQAGADIEYQLLEAAKAGLLLTLVLKYYDLRKCYTFLAKRCL